MTALPDVVPIRVAFPRPVVGDVRAATRDAAAELLRASALRPGSRVAVTAGSRGIAGIAEITRAVVDAVREAGQDPFIVPAMGSHGGGTAEGQRALIAHYGVTEDAMGCPIDDTMETVPLGRSAAGVETFMARAAHAADGVIVLNRVKPHTDFHGVRESGIAKMTAIGLGKLAGARACHQQVFGIGLGAAITSSVEHLLETGKILGGIAILENAYHQTATIAAVPAAGLLERERELLTEARGLMGRLPLDEIDILVCDRMGKNISGQGLDTNIIGRSPFGYTQGIPWQPGMPVIHRIIVRDLTDETNGNAMGVGLVDFVPERLVAKIDRAATMLNSLTARTPENAKIPFVTPDDATALRLALDVIPLRDEGARLVYVRDTLELSSVYVSTACLPLLAGRSDVTVLGEPRPLVFDARGDLVSPFD